MTQPLALVLYEKLLPGSQLVNRLQDLRYRVQTLNTAQTLVEVARQVTPIVLLADLRSEANDVIPALSRLKGDPSTSHVPVIAFGAEDGSELQAQALKAGAKLIVSEAALLNHLPECLEQALEVD